MKKILSVFLCVVMLCMTGVAAFAADEEPYKIVSAIKLSAATMTIVYGGTGKLTATVVPSDAADTRVTWSSSNEALVKVDANGNLTAAKDSASSPSGKKNVTITCTSVQNPSVKAMCIVTVDNDTTTKNLQSLRKILDTLKNIFTKLTEFVKGDKFTGAIGKIGEIFKALIGAIPKTGA